MRPGTYKGTSEELQVEFRLERDPEGKPLALSGDMFVADKFLASLLCERPMEGEGRIAGPIRFIGNPRLFTGYTSVQADARGLGSFQIDVDLEGGHRDQMLGRLEWQGSSYRRISIEVDGLAGQPFYEAYTSRRGMQVSIQSAFAEAGLDARVRIDSFTRAPAADVMRGYSYAEIHRAMQERRDVLTDFNRIHTHIFVCSYLAERNGRNVLGVMYDFGAADLNQRAREGVAVFGQHPMFSDPRMPDATRAREFVYTIVHEVGHALNLTHSFDKARPAALSWMNYPQLYPLGAQAGPNHDGSDEFWRAFPEGFDELELRHLRHGTAREVAAGGFHFGIYEEGPSSIYQGGTAEPRRTSLMSNPLRQAVGVSLYARTSKRIYELGDPVFLELGVKTGPGISARIPDALDPSEGFVRITIEKPGGQSARYHPPLRLCARAPQLALRSSEYKVSHAIPLFLAADGPVFTEPGVYKVWVELGGIDGAKVAFADPVAVRIAAPDAQTEAFAAALWDSPQILQPLYLQHPLSNPDAFAALEEAAKSSGIAAHADNSAWSYINYVAALGWLKAFEAPGRRPFDMNEQKALDRMTAVNPERLPGSARARATSIKGKAAEKTAQRYVVGGIERVRAEIPPHGLFGQSGLDVPSQAGSANPFAIVVKTHADTPAFADIVSWNIQHLHGKAKKGRIDRIAEYMLAFRCDFWALQEVGPDGVEELVDAMNANGDLIYAFLAAEGEDGGEASGQQSACIYRTDTVRVRRLRAEGFFRGKVKVTYKKTGETEMKKVFHRQPLLCDVRVRQGAGKVLDFRCAIPHMKATDPDLADTGTGMRRAAAKELAHWVTKERDKGAEQDFIILGDMNAEEAAQGLAPFAKSSDMRLLSVGMKDKYGKGDDGAITRFASKRLLDHIVITEDLVAHMPKSDLEEQIIIRSDIAVKGFTKKLTEGPFAQYAFSDHLPVAVRFILGKDQD